MTIQEFRTSRAKLESLYSEAQAARLARAARPIHAPTWLRRLADRFTVA